MVSFFFNQLAQKMYCFNNFKEKLWLFTRLKTKIWLEIRTYTNYTEMKNKKVFKKFGQIRRSYLYTADKQIWVKFNKEIQTSKDPSQRNAVLNAGNVR